MTDDVSDVPVHGVTGGAIGAAYHLFDELALYVPPSQQLKEIRLAIAVLADAPDHTKEADAGGVDGGGIQSAPQDLDKLAAALIAARPTNWCDIVARAELAAFYAPNEYCHDKPRSTHRRAVADLIRTILELSRRSEPEPSQAEPEQSGEEEAGCVYLAQSGQHFKIGRSNTLEDRIRTLKIQLPEKLVVVHHIKTDDPPGIETYWHRRFADQRKNGEWFELSPEDVEMFKARNVM